MNGLVKGALIVAALAGVGAGGHFGYKSIADQNRKMESLKTENVQLKEDNETKSKEITSLKNDLMDKNTSLVKLQGDYDNLLTEYSKLVDVEIPRIQNELAEKTSQLESANSQISTLITQKVSLLSAVTEIDNVINETEDAVEIENLEARKNAILVQIDSLNTQISSLTDERRELQTEVESLKVEKQNLQTEITQLQEQKTQLEKEIASLNTQISDLRNALSQLENTTGFEYITSSKMIYFQNLSAGLLISKSIYSFEELAKGNGDFSIGDSRFSDYSIYDNSQGQIENYLNEIKENNYSALSVSNYYKFVFNGTEKCYLESSESVSFTDKKISKLTVYYNGEKIEDFSMIKTLKFLALMSNFENEELTIYIVDFSPTGKYVSENGDYLDFDNKKMSRSGQIEEISDSYYNYDIFASGSNFTAIINYTGGWVYDINTDSFNYFGTVFTKSES